jgi:hypothetical protein
LVKLLIQIAIDSHLSPQIVVLRLVIKGLVLDGFEIIKAAGIIVIGSFYMRTGDYKSILIILVRD